MANERKSSSHNYNNCSFGSELTVRNIMRSDKFACGLRSTAALKILLIEKISNFTGAVEIASNNPKVESQA